MTEAEYGVALALFVLVWVTVVTWLVWVLFRLDDILKKFP